MIEEGNWLRKIDEPGDFIANLRHDAQSDNFILIHQQPIVEIVHGISGLAAYEQKQSQQGKKTLQFQSNVYDALMLKENLIVSNRNMPVRLYSKPMESSPSQSCWSSFNDKKPNSELYLFPLQFAKLGDTVIGGGKKFLSQYDCSKMVVKRMKEMSKKFVSSLEIINQSTIVAGQFDGTLSFMDIRSQQSIQSLKPHFDMVTRIVRAPQRQHEVVTLARKDNYSYLWDCRRLDTFLHCYQQPLYGNQRTGLDVSRDGQRLFLGDQSGKITARSLDHQEIQYRYFSNVDRCISSLCEVEGGLIFAVGQREFPENGKARSGYIGYAKMPLQAQ